MTKNPFLNAFLAAIYIIIIVFVIDAITSITAIQKTILIPIVMLSLFVLSTAVMGFLFVYEPATLHFEDRKQEAVLLFMKTVGTFACFVALFLSVLLYTSAL